jgi:tRNA threonylcarbamoyladenosine biosynthesis protein TsaE
LLAFIGPDTAECTVMLQNFISNSTEETLAIAEVLGKGAGPGAVFGIVGGLGAGKTIMAKGIAKGLGITEEITSPTFTLLEIYEGIIPLYHFDLYRIEKSEELDQLFFEEYWEDDGVSVIEWADRAPGRLPADRTTISIEQTGDTSRRITVERPGD